MDEELEIPIAKRQKLDETKRPSTTGSRLFAPFRTVGLVSPTPVPFTSIPLGKTTFQITTSVGRSLQTYDLRRGLNLVFLSHPLCPETITSTCAYRDRVFVAWGNENTKNGHGIWIFKRGSYIDCLEGTNTPQKIQKIVVFGNWVVGCGTDLVEVWKNDTYEHYTTIIPSQATGSVSLTGQACVLPTFLNKIFVGKTDGSVDIFNVSTGKHVHTIARSNATAGSVTCLSPGPAISLLAVAYSSGTLNIIDVETEEIIMALQNTEATHAITSVTFRSDGIGAGDDGQSDGIMATASIGSGDITIWDLTRGGKVLGVLHGAHEMTSTISSSGISGIEFLPGQSVIVSSGLDNALKTWVFDQVPFSHIPRILHARSGHAAAVTQLKFLPAATDGSEANGKWLLSAGSDRSLWGFSLRRDGQSSELSQGNIKHKAKKTGKLASTESSVEDFKCPPITGIACSLNRDGGMGAVGGPVWTNPSMTNAEISGMTGWESIVTSHENDSYARTWFWGRKKAGRWAFQTGDRKPVSSVTITSCGTFAVVGSANGSLDMFNLQSGLHRQRFPPKLKPSHAKQVKLGQLGGEQLTKYSRGHSDAITGIVVDNMNQTMVSTGLDGQVIFWAFITGFVQERLKLDSTPISVTYNPVSGLMSMACDDLCIRVVDVETKRIVRELWGCVGQIYDHCFSHDGRWILACSMDSVIRVFDLATGHLIDGFKTNTCTSLAFSGTGEYLATAHAGEIGINIWTNKSLFMHISSRQIDEEKDLIDLSNITEFQASNQIAIMDEQDEQEQDVNLELESTIDQLDKSLLTLSLLPQSRWQTLLNIESIRQRNKPVQPPQKPKAAPFFLGSTLTNGERPNGTDILTGTIENSPAVSEEERSRISRLSSLQPVKSNLSTHLDTFSSKGQNDALIDYLVGLSPSAAELDIRSLTIEEMPFFVRAMTARLQQRRDFELVNTWMAVFLKLHGEFVSGVPDIQRATLEFQKVMNTEEVRLSQSVGWTRGVVEFLRSSR